MTPTPRRLHRPRGVYLVEAIESTFVVQMKTMINHLVVGYLYSAHPLFPLISPPSQP